MLKWCIHPLDYVKNWRGIDVIQTELRGGDCNFLDYKNQIKSVCLAYFNDVEVSTLFSNIFKMMLKLCSEIWVLYAQTPTKQTFSTKVQPNSSIQILIMEPQKLVIDLQNLFWLVWFLKSIIVSASRVQNWFYLKLEIIVWILELIFILKFFIQLTFA
jgi:hypothetical protein